MTDDLPCPVCGRVFAKAKGRAGHLATFNDAAHAAFRQAHGMKAPLGPNHQPTKAGTRVRGTRAANPTAPARSPIFSAPAASIPHDDPTEFRRALQELTEKSLEASRTREPQRPAELLPRRAMGAPLAPPPAPPAPTPAPATQVPEVALPASPAPPPPPPEPQPPGPPKWLAAAGIGASAIGLAAVVKGLKGANAPPPEQFPESPTGRPAMALPDAIWAKPEAQPETTGNDWLDNQLGYTGIKTRRRGIL